MSSANHCNPIFLTPEEDERIRKSLKSRLQKYQELTGHPRISGDHKFRQNQVLTASLLSDLSTTPKLGLKVEKGGTDAW